MTNKPATNSGIDRTQLVGAAFLMATSAIGPGFLTQTATFTEQLGATFGFVILVSVILALVAQLNIWRIISVTGLHGQEVANQVLPGLGVFISFLVAFGGMVFNIGNVGGSALGLNVIFGLDTSLGVVISAALAIFIFANKSAADIMDRLTTILGAIMILLIAYVMFATQPPVGQALKRTLAPDVFPHQAILTLVGGTVGGYITFSGAHRLLATGKAGEDHLPQYMGSAKLGMAASSLVRVLLFLAILGVVSKGQSLDPSNPAADAFLLGAGPLGYKFFGVVLFAAGVSSVIGCAYTSVSFLTDIKWVRDHRNKAIIAFILLAALVMIIVGQPATLLVLAGSVNGLILPFTLGAMLIASRKKDIVGDYKHPQVLFILGVLVVVATAVVGVRSLSGLAALFQ
ncbi:MAG: divalent metal cation transporter [Tissierellia bacterium]|nr:divalent metal cation transporter [Tissierellia bacterium]